MQLALDTATWDIGLDGSGNIAVLVDPSALLAQRIQCRRVRSVYLPPSDDRLTDRKTGEYTSDSGTVYRSQKAGKPGDSLPAGLD